MSTEDVKGLNIVIHPRDTDQQPQGPGNILSQMGPVFSPEPEKRVLLGLGDSLYSPGRAVRLTMQAAVGNTVQVDIRGKRTAAQIVALPFYKREK